MGYIIGIDIGGTNFRIGAVDEAGKTSLFRKVCVGSVFTTEEPLKDLEMYLRDYIKEAAAWEISPEAIAIGFPATLDKNRNIVLQAPNIPFMENLPVRKYLTEALGLPVLIDRDVVFALAYDENKYRIPPCEVMIGCYFGTGIGNVISVNGQILSGRNGTAGELGHIPVDGNTRACGCGNQGCMETVAGGKYLAGLCQDVYAGERVGDLFLKHGKEPLLQQFVDRIAMTVATEINILNPDYVLLGGGVLAMEGFPRVYLLEGIHRYTRKPYPSEDLRVIFTDDDEKKCVVGGTFCARQEAQKRVGE